MSHPLRKQDTPASGLADARILGVDVRPRSFGFVVLEGMNVVDCGSRACELSGPVDCLSQRLLRILETYGPTTVVMRSSGARRLRYQKRSSNAASMRETCIRFGANVVNVRPRAVREHFQNHNARTKYEIAEAVASLLPELGWKLPPQRKPWQSEHHRMAIFDAAAIVLTYVGATTQHPVTLA